jgi:hypothetical protein
VRPDKFTYTMILSSPAHIPGEIESDRFFLTIAWPDFNSGHHEIDPNSRYSRNFFALTFREPELSPDEEKTFRLPHYQFVGEYFTVFLSLYYGKRFDYHGYQLDHGLYRLPNIEPAKPRKSSQSLPFSSKPRKDLGIPLLLTRENSLMPILNSVFSEVTRDVKKDGSLPEPLVLAYTAGRFYQKALEMFESEPEFAFLSLINSGEVLVSGLKFENSELEDAALNTIMSEVDAKLEPKIAEEIRKRFFGQISRRFRKGLVKLLNSAFFAGSETEEFLRLTPTNVEDRLKAAYELRSIFMHEGTPFGWVVSHDYQGNEISLGQAAYGEDRWKKITGMAHQIGRDHAALNINGNERPDIAKTLNAILHAGPLLLLADEAPNLVHLDQPAIEVPHGGIHHSRATVSHPDAKAHDRIPMDAGHPLNAAN